ncbi:MAG: trans-4-hydroxy-L-proline dehydratase [Candidatus Kariarchaeaceae archaeon]
MDFLSIEDEVTTRRSVIKPITERIEKLREESVTSDVKISHERAELITEFYLNTNEELSIVITRALAFKHLMENVSLPIEEGQLLVGMRGTGKKEVSTFPEVCCHGLDDLSVLNTREKNSYKVNQETFQVHKEKIIPFWKDKSMRAKIFSKVSEEWKEAYNAGIFTEFMEQRVPGHTSGGKLIFSNGIDSLTKRIIARRGNNPSQEELEELKAMEIVGEAIVIYANRYSSKLKEMALVEKNQVRKKELLEMAKICSHVPKNEPETFWEALQHYWFIHVGIITESNPWDAFNPGRLDQFLFPFYQKDIQEGKLTREKAKELLEAFWLKFNAHPAPPKVGVTAQESNTYNDFSKINIGGLKEDGSDGINEVSYLLLEVLEQMRTLQPNTAVLISKRTPNKFIEKALHVSSHGFGEPPIFSHDTMIMILLRQGKSLEDARMGGVSGCVETGAFGKESYILTGYFNLPKVLEITLNNGIDPRTNNKIGITTGNPLDFQSFEQLYNAFKEQLSYFIDIKMTGNDIIEELYASNLPVPFLSLWIEDCIDNAKDYNSGGAKYNTQYIQIVGLGTITDSLASLKHHVYEKERYTMKQVLEALENNFKENEVMKQIFKNKTPKFGNDNDFADNLAQLVFNDSIKMVESYPPSPVREATRRVYGLPTTCHVYFGSVCQATPDGREAEIALSEGISPVQGADRKGISAVFRSIGKLDHIKSGGTLLNQKLSPDLVNDEEVMSKLAQLIRAYFAMNAHHVQFNVVSAELLKEAQEKPEEFRDLMVRVAGYSDYFVNLPLGLQEEIINRTEQTIL